MCGRYYIDEETTIKLQELVADMDQRINLSDYVGDIVPSVMTPVIISHNQEMSVKLLSWGFQNYDKRGLLINARAETVSEKRLFKDCLYARRCVIPAAGFYEWDKSKNKFTFTHEKNNLMLMSGLYNEEGRFVIITTKANESMEPIHDRMPLVLTTEWAKTWLNDNKEIDTILRRISPPLKRNTEMEQMRLEFF